MYIIRNFLQILCNIHSSILCWHSLRSCFINILLIRDSWHENANPPQHFTILYFWALGNKTFHSTRSTKCILEITSLVFQLVAFWFWEQTSCFKFEWAQGLEFSPFRDKPLNVNYNFSLFCFVYMFFKISFNTDSNILIQLKKNQGDYCILIELKNENTT